MLLIFFAFFPLIKQKIVQSLNRRPFVQFRCWMLRAVFSRVIEVRIECIAVGVLCDSLPLMIMILQVPLSHGWIREHMTKLMKERISLLHSLFLLLASLILTLQAIQFGAERHAVLIKLLPPVARQHQIFWEGAWRVCLLGLDFRFRGAGWA